MSGRMFPIQQDHERDAETGEMLHYAATEIPWWLAKEAYDWYSKNFGTSQSLERLAERGGFGRKELLMLLRREKL